jgi:uncharacterized cupredoxin-like copper-binding protein
LAITTLALAALVGGLLAGTGHAVPGKASAAPVTKITVTASEWKFKLSKSTLPKTGRVAFKVVNKGKIGHDFKIAGKKTKLLNPGQSQTITVNFGKKGHFAYLCTVTGHAKLGMKGTFNVAAKPISTSTSTTTTGGTTSTTTTVTGPATTVNVSMKEYSFTLSQNPVPQGTITFVIKNDGIEPHNFDIGGVKAGAILGPGQTETWTVGLAAKAGGYPFLCDVPFHADRGMTGLLTVT